MKVFHGTGAYALDGFLTGAPFLRTRDYLPRLARAFCTTTHFKIAELFAIRHTNFDEMKTGGIGGVVLEFEMSGQEGSDFLSVVDHRALQKESEVAIFDVAKLRLTAVWRFKQDWVREELHEAKTHNPDTARRVGRKRQSRHLQDQAGP